MTRPRVPETDHGIVGEAAVRLFDQMQRGLRDKGRLRTPEILESGIDHGLCLEIGPGPGYLGLEWLKRTQNTQLRCVDISRDMLTMAEGNARQYGLSDRVCYLLGDGQQLPFEDVVFDAVFSTGSLHEWSHPARTFDEIARVLKPGGRYFIGDLRRDVSLAVRWFLYWTARPVEIRPGLLSSINAAYTEEELLALLCETSLRAGRVRATPFGLQLAGVRA